MSTYQPQETAEHWTDETLPLSRRKELLAEDLRRVAPRARNDVRDQAKVPAHREHSGSRADN